MSLLRRQHTSQPYVRLLREADRNAILRLCALNPLENIFVASRVFYYGVERKFLGCDMLGYFEQNQLVSALHLGSNLVPVNLSHADMHRFVECLPHYRISNSIMGSQQQVLELYEALSTSGKGWHNPRECRDNQPLLVIDCQPAVTPNAAVQQIDLCHFDSYFEASVRMYTEEVGVSPLANGFSYKEHVRRLIEEGKAFGIVQNGQVVFKTDVGSNWGDYCQVQGVWLDPNLRGQGLASHAVAGVVRLLKTKYSTVSLYVNDFNRPALATYFKAGFRVVSTFATVLY